MGITNTDVVKVASGRIARAIDAPSRKGVSKRLLSVISDCNEEIAITGAGARGEIAGLRKALHSGYGSKAVSVTNIDEIGAIGIGGAKLACLDRCIVASIGTGTAIVYVEGKRCEHLGGTGVGGGTLVGLGKRMLGLGDAEGIGALAKTGKWERVNITVGDVYGHGVGIVPSDATAANFAKNGKARNADLAAGIVDLVGETAGVLACFAAREKGVRQVVFVGAAPTLHSMQLVLGRTARMFGMEAIVPEEAKFSTAFGATLCREYNIYIKRKP